MLWTFSADPGFCSMMQLGKHHKNPMRRAEIYLFLIYQGTLKQDTEPPNSQGACAEHLTHSHLSFSASICMRYVRLYICCMHSSV